MKRFCFVANPRPLLHGGMLGTATLLFLFGWAWWTGRIVTIDATYLGVLLGSAGISVPLVLGNQWWSSRKAASALGYLEFDQQGVRWNRDDASLGFAAPGSGSYPASSSTQISTLLLAGRRR